MVKSPLSDVEIPEVTIHQVAFQMMEMHADKVALVDGMTETEMTYARLLDAIKRTASGLVKLGLKPKEIVAILSPNSPEYVIMFFAVLACGAAVSTINPVYTAYEVRKHLEDSRANYIFASQETAPVALQAADQAQLNQTTIVSGSYPGCLPLSSLIVDDGSMFPQNVDINVREHVATIPYSSGTTGFPKGVMITHYNLVSMLSQMSHPDLNVTPVDGAPVEQAVIMTFLPFFHAYGMVGLMIGRLLRGDKLILMSRFIPEKFLYLIQKYKVTMLPLVPPVVVFMAKSPLVQKYDLSSIQSVSSGAAPLAKETEDDFLKVVHLPEMRQGYGMTETTLACAYPLATKPLRAGSCGVPLPNNEMQVVDPNTKKVLGVGERGEIWVRGPNIMKGYLNRPDATRETLDEDGWLHTGDVGYYDKDCYFYIVDRIKELIKYKGFQVAPAELEALLLNHPNIDDVAVIGVPDVAAGELPRAYVVKKPGANLTVKDVKDYVAAHVSSFKHLTGGVEFIDVIPKSQSGKILRRELRDRLTKSKL